MKSKTPAKKTPAKSTPKKEEPQVEEAVVEEAAAAADPVPVAEPIAEPVSATPTADEAPAEIEHTIKVPGDDFLSARLSDSLDQIIDYENVTGVAQITAAHAEFYRALTVVLLSKADDVRNDTLEQILGQFTKHAQGGLGPAESMRNCHMLLSVGMSDSQCQEYTMLISLFMETAGEGRHRKAKEVNWEVLSANLVSDTAQEICDKLKAFYNV